MSSKIIKYISLVVFVLLVCISCGISKEVKGTNTLQKNNIVIDTLHKTPIISDHLTERKMSLSDTTSTGMVQTKSEQVDTIIEPAIEKKILFDHSIWDKLLKQYVRKDGAVDYIGFKKDKVSLKNYLTSLSENMPDETWSKADKLAYWMNAYNAFTIKLIIDNYPIKSIKEIKSPWDIRFFKLGKKWYNLNEIEHQILRKMEEPRIHFGINCASFSCPPLLNQAFTSKNVYQQLENLTRNFINDPLRNSLSYDRVELSKIFSWFAKDFKTKGTLIDFLNTYTNIQIHPKAKKVFLEYDWRLNEI